MKNYVIMLAGGVGQRMNTDIPKQFLEIEGKPIIVYSLENFQKNESIAKILIVCRKEWEDRVRELIQRYHLTKVEWIVNGGNTGHDSIRNGVFFLKDKLEENDYVIIHDSVRPVLPQSIIDDVINVAHIHGNACSSIACHPPIVYKENEYYGIKDINREQIMLTEAPQCFRYSDLLKLYQKAELDNKHNFTYTSSLFIHYGYPIYFAKGTTLNIKITQKEDLALFQALLQILGEEL